MVRPEVKSASQYVFFPVHFHSLLRQNLYTRQTNAGRLIHTKKNPKMHMPTKQLLQHLTWLRLMGESYSEQQEEESTSSCFLFCFLLFFVVPSSSSLFSLTGLLIGLTVFLLLIPQRRDSKANSQISEYKRGEYVCFTESYGSSQYQFDYESQPAALLRVIFYLYHAVATATNFVM